MRKQYCAECGRMIDPGDIRRELVEGRLVLRFHLGCWRNRVEEWWDRSTAFLRPLPAEIA